MIKMRQIIALLALTLAVSLIAGELDARSLFYDDFSDYNVGESPGGDWILDTSQFSTAFVDERDGLQTLTMTNTDPFSDARAMAHFDPPPEDTVVLEFEWNRLTGRAYQNHEGNGVAFVPAIYLLSDAEGTDTGTWAATIRFRSWDRMNWAYRLAEEEVSGAIETESSDFLFDEPLQIRLHYTRSSGAIRLQVSKDNYETVVYDMEVDGMPGLDINGVGILSANRTGDDRLYADPIWDINYVSVTAEGDAQIGGYGDWVTANLSDYPEEQERFDDPGGYGVPNFARYAFALDPLQPFGSPLRDLHESSDGGPVAISFFRYEGIEDVSYTVESTDDLAGEWDTNALQDLATETISLGDGREEVVVSAPPGEADRQFFRIRAGGEDGPANAIFYEDFETYSTGETPSGEWMADAPQDTEVFVDGEAGNRYLTMTDVSEQDHTARVVRIIDMEGAESVSVTYEWTRKTDSAYQNHLGNGVANSPALYLLRDVSNPPAFWSSDIMVQFVFRSWNRSIAAVLDVNGELTSTSTESDDFRHDDPLKVRITYRRVGELIVEVSLDDFETVEWSMAQDTIPDVNVNAVAIRSANRAHESSIYADPIWEVGSVLVTSADN